MNNESRLGVVGIVVENREASAQINKVLSDYGHLIVGRMGIPHRDRHISVISLIVDGTTDEIGVMTGKIGNIKDVQVKSALATR